jgi:hypothetical protein
MSRILPRRIALVGTQATGGSAVVSNKIREFLEANGIEVDFFDIYIRTWPEVVKHRLMRTSLEMVKHRLMSRFDGQSIYECFCRDLASVLRRRGYPVVIAVEKADIFFERLAPGTGRLYFCQSPLAHERYYRRLYRDDPHAEQMLHKDVAWLRAMYEASDAVTFAWNTYESFVRERVYNGSNIVSHPGLGWYGCEPQVQRARYRAEPALVYLGNIAYFSNPELLARLTALLSYPLDCYGPIHVPEDGLRYFGYAEDEWETLRRYQFGVNTVSMDPVRLAGFSSKVLAYLSVGLPFSHQVEGVVPFELEDLPALIEEYRVPEAWHALSDAAYEQANALRWGKVLQPLLDLL